MNIACQNGHVEIVKVLLTYGANVHVKNKVSTTYNMIITIIIVIV